MNVFLDIAAGVGIVMMVALVVSSIAARTDF